MILSIPVAKNRWIFCFLIAALSLMSRSSRAQQADSASLPSQHPKLGINLAGIADWSSELPFTDIFKTSRAWISQQEGKGWGQGPALTLDGAGNVMQLPPGVRAETPMLWDIRGHYPAGDYSLFYEGAGNVDLWNVKEITRRERGSLRFRLNGENGFFLQLQQTDPQNPLRNFRVYLPGFEDGKVLFNPLFLERLRPFGTLRFMDWGATNNSTMQQWNQRPRVADARWSINGVPVEIMVEAANTLNVNPWFTLPHQADDDFVRRYAQLVKETLHPHLKVYVEYSNEVWNGMFAQATYAREQGKRLGLAENDYQAQLRFYARRTVQIGKIWKEVFGADADRVVCVMSSQAANPWVSEQVLSWQDAYKHVDALAIAPYFGGQFGDPARQSEVTSWSMDQLFDHLQNEVRGQTKTWITEQAAIARRYQLPLLAYEGGQHLVGHGGAENNEKLTNFFIAANRHPRMAALYQLYLQQWFESGGDLMMIFSHVAMPSKWGSWGILEFQDQPLGQAPKYRGIVDFIKKAQSKDQ